MIKKKKRLSKKKKILVIGDYILDLFHFGKVERISPEANIPVFRSNYENDIISPGGAGNVAANLAHMSKNFDVYFTIPNFEHKKDLPRFEKVNLVRIGDPAFSRKYIEKHRFYDIEKGHQVGLRYDIEDHIHYREFGFETLVKNLQTYYEINSLSEFDAIVLSDYGKGVFGNYFISDIKNYLNICKLSYGKRPLTFLDYKGHTSIKDYNFVDFFKPNLNEYHKYLQVKDECFFKNILLTKASEGMEFIRYDPKTSSNEKPFEMVSSFNLNQYNKDIKKNDNEIISNIVDVTGAGDIVMCSLVYYTLNEFKDYSLLAFASKLANISCLNFGTYLLKEEDIEEAIMFAKLSISFEKEAHESHHIKKYLETR